MTVQDPCEIELMSKACADYIQNWNRTIIISYGIASMGFGAFLILASRIIRSYIQERKSVRAQRPINAIAIASMLVICFLSFGLVTRINLDNFTGPPGRTAALTNFVLTNIVLYYLQGILVDAVLLYRVYFLHQSIWPTVPGIIIGLGVLASGARILQVQVRNASTPPGIWRWDADTYNWLIIHGTLSAAQSVISTMLIIFKIVKVAGPANRLRNYQKTIILLLESGSVYSLMWLLDVVCTVRKNAGVIFFLTTFIFLSACTAAALILQLKVTEQYPSKGSITTAHFAGSRRRADFVHTNRDSEAVDISHHPLGALERDSDSLGKYAK